MTKAADEQARPGAQDPFSYLRGLFSDVAASLHRLFSHVSAFFFRHKRMSGFVVMVLVAAIVAPLASVPDSSSTPGGMLSLEFLGTRSGAVAALKLLDAPQAMHAIGRREIAIALSFDFVLIIAYVYVLTDAVQWVIWRRRLAGESFEPWEPQMVDRFAREAPLVAGLFDGTENTLILLLLNWSQGKNWAGILASLITVAACVKWTLLVFVCLYLVYSLFPIFRHWRSAEAGR